MPIRITGGVLIVRFLVELSCNNYKKQKSTINILFKITYFTYCKQVIKVAALIRDNGFK
jgi:hypothetical protein